MSWMPIKAYLHDTVTWFAHHTWHVYPATASYEAITLTAKTTLTGL
jgi:hypothetical protein